MFVPLYCEVKEETSDDEGPSKEMTDETVASCNGLFMLTLFSGMSEDWTSSKIVGEIVMGGLSMLETGAVLKFLLFIPSL